MYGIDELHIPKTLRDLFDRLEDIFEPFSETFSPMGCHKNKLVLKVDHPENRILVFYIRRSHCNRINHCISSLKNVFNAFEMVSSYVKDEAIATASTTVFPT